MSEEIGWFNQTEVRYGAMDMISLTAPGKPIPTGIAAPLIRIQTLSGLEDHVNLIDGRFAKPTTDANNMEVVIPAEAAKYFNVKVGDQVQGGATFDDCNRPPPTQDPEVAAQNALFRCTPQTGVELRATFTVVGIVERVDPNNRFWGAGYIQFVPPFPTDTQGPIMPVLLPEQSFFQALPGALPRFKYEYHITGFADITRLNSANLSRARGSEPAERPGAVAERDPRPRDGDVAERVSEPRVVQPGLAAAADPAGRRHRRVLRRAGVVAAGRPAGRGDRDAAESRRQRGAAGGDVGCGGVCAGVGGRVHCAVHCQRGGGRAGQDRYFPLNLERSLPAVYAGAGRVRVRARGRRHRRDRDDYPGVLRGKTRHGVLPAIFGAAGQAFPCSVTTSTWRWSGWRRWRWQTNQRGSVFDVSAPSAAGRQTRWC